MQRRRIREQRAAGVMLDPLAQICIGMLVAIMVGRRQLVVDFQCNRERSQYQQHAGHHQR